MGNRIQLTGRGRLLTLVIGAALLGLFILTIISGGMQKWLWMKQLDYAVITLLSVKWHMFCMAFVVAFCTCGAISILPQKKGAVLLDGHSAGPTDILPEGAIQVPPAGLKLAMVMVSVVAAFFLRSCRY